MVEKTKKTKRKIFKSPSAFAGLFVVIAFMAVLTWIIPSGAYDTKPHPTEPDKTVRIEGTYKEVPKVVTEKNDEGKEVVVSDSRQGLWDVLIASIKGMAEKLDVIVFVLVLGGFLGVVMKTGALDAMLEATLRRMKGHEKWLIPILMTLFAIGGTTYGMQEETVAFYALVIPVMVAAGYNAMTAVFVIVLGSGAGLIGSTINPFSTGIAAKTADMPLPDVFPVQIVVFILSLIAAIAFTMNYAARVKSGKYAKDDRTKPTVATLGMAATPAFTARRKVIMGLFSLTFSVMIISLIPWSKFGITIFHDFHVWLSNLPVVGAVLGSGHNVEFGDWYFNEISTLFIAMAIVIGIVYRREFRKEGVLLVDTFIKGVGDMLSVALIVAVATGVSVIMTSGAIQDTVIHWGEDLLRSAGGGVVGVLAFFFYLPMSFLIPSSSGLAAATMPILAPVAELVGAGKDMIVAGYATAVGLVNLFAPTVASLMGGLALAGVSYRKYLVRVWPMMVIFALISLGVIALFGAL